jgi:PAS domain S-box-containing protein
LSNIGDGVFTVDSRFRITFFNEAAEEITGFSKEEAIGRYCHEVFRTPICDQDCPLRQSLRTGRRVKNFEIDIRTKNKKRQTISVSTAPLVEQNGTFLGGVETFRDLSTIKGLRREIAGKFTFQDIIAKTPQMRQIFQTLPNIAQSDATVLIHGRSGTGKELFANAIHNLSPRADGPLVTVNCGALPETLLESELFGYVRGAFTDAKQDRAGRFQAAEGGTIFLDEIGDSPLSIQVKLLRVLENREYQPLGSEQTMKTDVRVVAATNQNLDHLVASGRFREDLYYRLNVILIHVPDLRERKEDIPLLCEHFIESFSQRTGRNLKQINDDAMAVLMRYHYPGNVRELENILEHAYIISGDPYIRPEDLPTHFTRPDGPPSHFVGGRGPAPPLLTPNPTVTGPSGHFDERQMLIDCLERNFWNIPRAARELGIHRTTMWRKVKRLNIETP